LGDLSQGLSSHWFIFFIKFLQAAKIPELKIQRSVEISDIQAHKVLVKYQNYLPKIEKLFLFNEYNISIVGLF
jgi:hypothetical protein